MARRTKTYKFLPALARQVTGSAKKPRQARVSQAGSEGVPFACPPPRNKPATSFQGYMFTKSMKLMASQFQGI